MSNKTTPGNWRVDYESNPMGPIVGPRGSAHIQVGGENAFADSRLVAAAPELLQALRQMHSVVHEHYCGIMGTDYHSSLCRIATEAIRKAERGE